jgi:hypothetical protein
MARRGLPHGRSGHRFAFLTGAAALGAVGVALIFPTGPVQAQTAEASMASAVDAETGEVSAQAAAAIPQAQARAHTIADITAQRTAAAQAAQAAQAATAEHANAGPDDFRAYAKQKVGAAQFGCLDKLWTRESHWHANADNPSSTAYGIAQLLDSTWSHTGYAKTSDGYRQVDAGLVYIDKAYGSPCNAWAHSQSHGWY